MAETNIDLIISRQVFVSRVFIANIIRAMR